MKTKPFVVLIVLTAICMSCSNDGEGVSNILPSLTESQSLATFKADDDWETIVELNQEFFLKIVSKKINPKDILNFSEDEFLTILGYTREDYYKKVTKIKTSASRLIIHYNLPNYVNDCESCRLDENSKWERLNRLVSSFRQEPGNLALFFNTIKSSAKPGNMEGLSTQEPGCSWKFYACCAMCAATIEAFPLYLACCAFCMDSYCENAPWN